MIKGETSNPGLDTASGECGLNQAFGASYRELPNTPLPSCQVEGCEVKNIYVRAKGSASGFGKCKMDK